MNHLLMPSNSLGFSTGFRLLSTDAYECDAFDTYPERQGWTRRTLREWQYLFQNPTREFQAFLQRWLFLGPLTALSVLDHETLMAAFDTNIVDQSKCSGMRFILEMHVLYLARLSKDAQSTFYDELMRWKSQVIRPALDIHTQLALIDAESGVTEPAILETVQDLLTYVEQGRDCDPRDPVDAVATALLLESLNNLVVEVRVLSTAPSGPELAHWMSVFAQPVTIPESLWISLRSCGWCPFEIAIIMRTLPLSGILFLKNVPRPDQSQIHRMITIRDRANRRGKSPYTKPVAADDSSSCKSYQCSLRKLSDDTYETRHCVDCHGCRDVVANPLELQAILVGDGSEDGSIPLIMSIDPENDSDTIQLVKWKPEMDYVAISHVWSDGLGNVTRNAIPHCQMVRLSKTVRDVQTKHGHTILFWLDTICVPPDGTGQDEAQRQALQRMRQTYEKATAVVVLDSWLMSNSATNVDDSELILKISLSVWNRRLWTYQEAALPRRLLFRFRDSYFDIDEAWARICESDDMIFIQTLLGAVYERYMSIRGFRLAKQSFSEKLKAVIDACAFRATSVLEDEALCLGALLDLDMAQILDAPPAQRLQKFWSLLSPFQVPIYVVGFQESMSTKGFRWGPRTLLASKWNLQSNERTPTIYWEDPPICGTVTELGFRVETQGLVFPVHYPIGYESYVKDEYENWFNIRTYMADDEGVVFYQHDMNGNLQKRRKWKGVADAELPLEIVFIPFSLKGFKHHVFNNDTENAEIHSQYTLAGPGILGLLPAGASKIGSPVRKLCIASFRKSTQAKTGGFESTCNMLGSMFGIDSGLSAPGNLNGRGGDHNLQCLSRGTWQEREWCID